MLVALVALVSGCAAPDQEAVPSPFAPGTEVEVEYTPTTGAIQGIVLDEALTPIQDATIAIQPTGRTTTSNSGGAFGFSTLEPGIYFLEASREGWLVGQSSIEVQAGHEPPMVKVVLERNLGNRSYVELYEFTGFLACAAGGSVGSILVPCASVSPQHRPRSTIQLDYGMPDWVQTELMWRSTQPLGTDLRLDIGYYQLNGSTAFTGFNAFEGQSPILGTLDRANIEEWQVGVEKGLRITVEAPQLGVVVNQAYSVYTHVFFGYNPPEGWRFSADGAPPGSPQP